MHFLSSSVMGILLETEISVYDSVCDLQACTVGSLPCFQIPFFCSHSFCLSFHYTWMADWAAGGQSGEWCIFSSLFSGAHKHKYMYIKQTLSSVFTRLLVLLWKYYLMNTAQLQFNLWHDNETKTKHSSALMIFLQSDARCHLRGRWCTQTNTLYGQL